MMTDEEAVTTAINEIKALRKQVETWSLRAEAHKQACIASEAALTAMTLERDGWKAMQDTMYYQPLAAMTAERDHYKEMDALHIQSLGLKSEKLAAMTQERDELRQHHTDEQDLNICPKCGGPADQGHDRCVPPSAYWCSECEEKDAMTPKFWKDAPETIYLQCCDDSDCDCTFNEHEEVTWCRDSINDTDPKYIRADVVADQLRAAKVQKKDIAELKWKVKVLREAVISWSSLIEFQYSGSKEAMTHMQICDNMGQAALEKTK